MSSENDTPSVEYRPVVGFPLYRVGNDGFVWTSIGIGARNRTVGNEWRRLIGGTLPGGYQLVLLRQDLRGMPCSRYVHRLVLEAFVGPRPEGFLCRHLDDNPSNNNLDNLRWGTPVENAADAKRNGRLLLGSSQPKAKLTESDIPIIRQLVGENVTMSEVARRYGVTKHVIHLIIAGKGWTHV